MYRFPALPPGMYTVTAELSNFKKSSQEARLELGQTITLDVKLEVGGLSDVVEVAGTSPTVDAKSSASNKNLTTDMLELLPFSSRFGPGAMLGAPGVNPNNYSAYGSGGSSSNALLIDGVDVGDPEGGTIWVFASHNWLQEVQIAGLGANAEFGGFTGVSSNSLFRSGSNRFRGLFETLYENDALTDSNTSAEILEQNDSLRLGEDQLLDRHDVSDRRAVQARQALVLHELPVLPAGNVAVGLPADHARGHSGRGCRSDPLGSKSHRASCSSPRSSLVRPTS